MAKKPGSKHKPSLLSWKKRKRLQARSEKGSQKSWWEVGCEVHGVQAAKGLSIKVVRTGFPKNTRRRMSGCPICGAGNV